MTPLSGPVGSSVTITGSNFNPAPSANAVFFGTGRATVTSASTTSLTVTVPAGTSYQPITVSTGGLSAWFYQPFVTTFADPGQFTAQAFATRTDFNTGDGPQSVIASDLDGDGKPELIVADGDSGTIEIYQNLSTPGSANFTLVYDYILPFGFYPVSVACGDLDGDGKPDIVVTNASSPSIAVFKNTSTTGSISMSATSPLSFPQGTYSTSVKIGDCNGDGKPEIVLTNAADNTVWVYPNISTIGTINFSTQVSCSLPSGSVPYDVVIGDFDGDGMPDIATANFHSNKVAVIRNTGSPGAALSFSTTVVYIPVGTNPYSLAVGDLDGDGKPDLAVCNYNANTISLLQNTSTSGSISFVKGTDVATGGNPKYMAIGDFDGDGLPDVASCNLGDNTVSVLRNLSTPGNIAVDNHVDYPTGYAPTGLITADLDGDGMPDFGVSDDNSPAITVLLNQSPSAAAISGITPTSGTSGTVVTITGVNLTGATAVSFGGVAAGAFSVISDTKILCTVGSGATGVVSVTTPAGIATYNSFTYGTPHPALINFFPTSGTTGTQVTIKGSGLTGLTSISFGGISATSFSVISDTVATAIVGSGATGAVNVASPGGSSALPGFSFVAPQPLTISSFSPLSGTNNSQITIKGVGLSLASSVYFGDVQSTSLTVFSDTMIMATVGGGASGEVSVFGSNGADSAGGFVFTASAPPPPTNIILTSFAPASGGVGTTVTIKGSHLSNATAVSFGGVPAVIFTATSDTQIVAVVSNGSSGEVKVTGSPVSNADSLAGFVFLAKDTSTNKPDGPFSLVQFSGVLNGNKPQMQWITINDQIIQDYVVERGPDSTHFVPASTVKRSKNDSSTHTYGYTDPNPLAGINFYRIKMQDSTAAYTYSWTISLQPDGTLMPVYPNPVKYGFFLVDIPVITKPSQFRLANMSGKVLQVLSIPAGVAQQRINIPGAMPGSYQLSWTNGTLTAYQTILVLPE